MAELVVRRDEDGIAILSLNRPEVLNALSVDLFVELREHVDRIGQQPDQIGCVILRGEGRSFSAGNDLKALAARPPSPHFQAETIEKLEALPQPVVGSVRGHCYTGALELALGCDLIVCGEGARFCDTHGKWAMTPTWGMTQRLPRRIGMTRAKELMWTGRVVSGPEAVAIGLANLCVPDDELDAKTFEFARSLTQNSWFTLQAEKKLTNAGAGLPRSEALAYERDHSPGRGPDMEERLKSFARRDSR